MNPTAAVAQSCLVFLILVVQHSLHITAALAAGIDWRQTSPTETVQCTEQDPCDQEVRVVALCVLLRHIVASRLAWRWHLARILMILMILRLYWFRESLLSRLLLLAWWRVRRIITFLRLIRSCHIPGWCPDTAATRSHTARNALQSILRLRFGFVNEQVMRRRDCAVKCRTSRMLRCIAARVVTCTCRTGVEVLPPVEEAQEAWRAASGLLHRV
jgi:hypothetical protein